MLNSAWASNAAADFEQALKDRAEKTRAFNARERLKSAHVLGIYGDLRTAFYDEVRSFNADTKRNVLAIESDRAWSFEVWRNIPEPAVRLLINCDRDTYEISTTLHREKPIRFRLCVDEERGTVYIATSDERPIEPSELATSLLKNLLNH